MKKIVFLGDSITLGIGYGGVTTSTRFSSLIGAAAGYSPTDVINAGVGGNNSADLLARLDSDVIAHDPGVCVVMIGNNDCYSTAPKFQTVAQYQANVTTIVQQLHAAGIKTVLFSPMYATGTPTASYFAQLNPYVKALEEVASTLKAPYVDLLREYHYMVNRGEWATHGHADNVHPSPNGHAFIAEYAMRPKHAGFFVANPATPDTDSGEHSALLEAVADYVLATGHPDLTVEVLARRN